MTTQLKDAKFRVKEQVPYNGEAPLEMLRRGWITPNELFFARNHGNIPEVKATGYCLRVAGMVERPLALTLEEIKKGFAERELTVTLECAGNRRAELAQHAPIPGELPWEAGAISTAVWKGAALADVLAAAGVQPGAAHVEFTGLDDVERNGQVFGFGGSIPLEKACSGETLLAYEMNGAPLSAAHGYPLRVVTPGYIGARSVKWLKEITVQAEGSKNYFYSRAYQLFPPQAGPDNVDWEKGIKLGELSVNAVICNPTEGARVPAGEVWVEGYAFAGGSRRVERVDVSLDGGKTWQTADLEGVAERWAWRFWRQRLTLEPGAHEVICRAWDAAANTQPEAVRDVWNFKGYMNNAWHRVSVQAS